MNYLSSTGNNDHYIQIVNNFITREYFDVMFKKNTSVYCIRKMETS